jgi:hypothetical protein
MAVYHATDVGVIGAEHLDYGEGWVKFCWPDPLYGHDGLQINFDGFCQREMHIHSGQGPPEFVALQRDRLKLRFSPTLAEKLNLEPEVEIVFNISEDEFAELKLVFGYFKELE